QVLSHAKSLGLFTTVTTNGFFVKPERLDRLRGLVDMVAISLDGPPEVHNKLRGSAYAFQRLQTAVENIRRTQIPFGFIHTLTQSNWKHLPWVAEFAATNGARLFQIHPLELTGRATTEMAEDDPEENVLEKVWILACALTQKYENIMSVQLDLLYQDDLRAEPEMVYAGNLRAGQATPAQLLGLL